MNKAYMQYRIQNHEVEFMSVPNTNDALWYL